jgi:hypothetical protein
MAASSALRCAKPAQPAGVAATAGAAAAASQGSWDHSHSRPARTAKRTSSWPDQPQISKAAGSRVAARRAVDPVQGTELAVDLAASRNR